MTAIAVVTGGNKGIGYAIVKGLCQKFDGEVYLTARDVARGESAVQNLNKLGLHPKFHQLDINDESSIDKFRNYIKEKYGGINVLVNNAAIAFKNDDPTPFAEQAEITVAVNYFSLLRVCRALFPLLRAHARVVNVSSSAGHLFRIPGEELRQKLASTALTTTELSALMNQFVEDSHAKNNVAAGWGKSAYVVSKVGVSALTFIQQREFDANTATPGIVVNAVHPGYVDTDMTSHKGPLTIEQGAEAPLFLALMPVDDGELKGRYVWHNKQVVDWFTDSTPGPV